LDAQFTICTPFPGSEAYERLIVDPQAIKRYPDVFEKTPQLLPKDTTMLKKHGLADAPSWELLQKDWASRFCDVDHERLQEVWRQIAKLDFRVFNPS